MAKQFSVDADVQTVLRDADIRVDRVILPPRQLDRRLYQRVNKVLTAAGGTWNRKAGGHVFPRDPREALKNVLETGEAEILQHALQAFYTPPALAADMALRAKIVYGNSILEPSAGMGSLAEAAARHTPMAHIRCVDIDPYAVEALRAKGFETEEQDFLTMEPDPYSLVDVVLMNPPFTQGQDMRHMLHAWGFLVPGGRLVTLAGAMVTHGTTKLHRQFQAHLAQEHAEVIPLPDGSFHEAGTDVRIVQIAMQKGNTP